jgi:threonine synthase
MRFVSTRGADGAALSEAIRAGLAADGGLFVPEALPRVAAEGPPGDLPREAARFLRPFFAGDPLEPHLDAVCREALDVPCPLVDIGGGDFLLELFHGPTAAFKDFGARFLAACLARLGAGRRTVMVATSGDTGGAVAAAFADRPEARVWILYPEGRISDRQEAQLTCWGDNVCAFAVQGAFDDCQRMVKEAFARDDLRARFGLTSANSINLGRLLPQAAYVWYAARHHRARTGEDLRAIVPTGNLGHGLAALWAREAGAPLADVVLALNANRAVLDDLETGVAAPRPAIPTHANAMDVGIPSNLERLRHLYPALEDRRRAVRAFTFEDAAIEACLRTAEARWGIVPCPHTACGLLARDALDAPGWTIFATAHPAKFERVLEPLVGQPIPPPPALAALLERPRRRTRIPPDLDALLAAA